MGKASRSDTGRSASNPAQAALAAFALARAREAMAAGRWVESLEWLASHVATTPAADALAAEVRYRYGATLAAVGRYSNAEAEFSAAAASRHATPLVRDRLRLVRLRHQWLKATAALRDRFATTCTSCQDHDLYTRAMCRHQRAPVPKAVKLPPTSLRPWVEEVFAPAAYRSGWDLDRNHPMSVLMRLEKAHIDDAALLLLGSLLAAFVGHHTSLPARLDAVVPIPTSREREQRRGGSIPHALAVVLRDQLALPLFEPLTQVAPHLDHTQARGEERRAGLRRAWKLQLSSLLVGRSVLLVDDILTTGTTMTTAAEMLREAGVAGVYGVALMHTERSST